MKSAIAKIYTNVNEDDELDTLVYQVFDVETGLPLDIEAATCSPSDNDRFAMLLDLTNKAEEMGYSLDDLVVAEENTNDGDDEDNIGLMQRE